NHSGSPDNSFAQSGVLRLGDNSDIKMTAAAQLPDGRIVTLTSGLSYTRDVYNTLSVVSSNGRLLRSQILSSHVSRGASLTVGSKIVVVTHDALGHQTVMR